MTNFDYLGTISLDKFAYFMCGLTGNINESSLQIMKSWLRKEVDDEFFKNQTQKKEYIAMFERYKKELKELQQSKQPDQLEDWYTFLLDLYKKSLS